MNLNKFKRPTRVWINQPSGLQPLHKYHGEVVTAWEEPTGDVSIYFNKGDVHSMRVNNPGCLETLNSQSNVFNYSTTNKFKAMGKEESKVGVALVKRACPICVKEEDAEIIMNSLLTEKLANDVESMHGRVVGFMEEPCEECKEKYEGRVALIEIVDGQSEEECGDNPIRTGLLVGLKHEAFKGMIGENAETMIKHRFTYIPKGVMKELLGEHYPDKTV